jgi:hypothetical protein
VLVDWFRAAVRLRQVVPLRVERVLLANDLVLAR